MKRTKQKKKIVVVLEGEQCLLTSRAAFNGHYAI